MEEAADVPVTLTGPPDVVADPGLELEPVPVEEEEEELEEVVPAVPPVAPDEEAVLSLVVVPGPPGKRL